MGNNFARSKRGGFTVHEGETSGIVNPGFTMNAMAGAVHAKTQTQLPTSYGGVRAAVVDGSENKAPQQPAKAKGIAPPNKAGVTKTWDPRSPAVRALAGEGTGGAKPVVRTPLGALFNDPRSPGPWHFVYILRACGPNSRAHRLCVNAHTPILSVLPSMLFSTPRLPRHRRHPRRREQRQPHAGRRDQGRREGQEGGGGGRRELRERLPAEGAAAHGVQDGGAAAHPAVKAAGASAVSPPPAPRSLARGTPRPTCHTFISSLTHTRTCALHCRRM